MRPEDSSFRLSSHCKYLMLLHLDLHTTFLRDMVCASYALLFYARRMEVAQQE
jgi:hypothetical protein